MWEEHPWYQKQQARTIGVGVVVILALYAAYAISEHDWHLLGRVLSFAAALIIAMGLLSGTAWLLVKVLARRPKDEPKEQQRAKH